MSLGVVLFCKMHRIKVTPCCQSVGRSLSEIKSCICIWAAGLKKKKVKTQKEYLLFNIWLHAFQILPMEALTCLPVSIPKIVRGGLGARVPGCHP